MSLINQTGTFRGKVTDRAVSLTTNNYLQFVVKLYAEEIYDVDEGVWVDWSVYDENEITAYLVLFDGKDNKTLNCQQVEKVFGWDGADLTELDQIDVDDIKIQFRVNERTYEGKTRLQVEWIDVYGAEPGRTIKKLNPDELKKLQARFKNVLTPKKAAKAPTKPAKPKVPVVKPDLPVAKTSKADAWVACVDLKGEDVSDEQLAKTWLSTIEKIAGQKDDSVITSEEWAMIQETVLDKIGKF